MGEGAPPVLRVPAWDNIPGLLHGFCGRAGGTSLGAFKSLNLSCRVGDAADAVRANWRVVQRLLGASTRIATLRQMHGSEILTVGDEAGERGEADGLATDRPGVALGVLTADCVPILLVAPQERVVAAVHAGWRGTLAGIVVAAVRHLERGFGVSPTQLQAALGPAIGPCCYEVDCGIADALESRWGRRPEAVRRGTHVADKAMVDLRAVNAAQLSVAGVARVTPLGPCTRCASAEYFSHRAVSGASGSGVTGRQLSFIGWKGTHD